MEIPNPLPSLFRIAEIATDGSIEVPQPDDVPPFTTFAMPVYKRLACDEAFEGYSNRTHFQTCIHRHTYIYIYTYMCSECDPFEYDVPILQMLRCHQRLQNVGRYTELYPDNCRLSSFLSIASSCDLTITKNSRSNDRFCHS